jgi:hypothetical protein
MFTVETVEIPAHAAAAFRKAFGDTLAIGRLADLLTDAEAAAVTGLLEAVDASHAAAQWRQEQGGSDPVEVCDDCEEGIAAGHGPCESCNVRSWDMPTVPVVRSPHELVDQALHTPVKTTGARDRRANLDLFADRQAMASRVLEALGIADCTPEGCVNPVAHRYECPMSAAAVERQRVAAVECDVMMAGLDDEDEDEAPVVAPVVHDTALEALSRTLTGRPSADPAVCQCPDAAVVHQCGCPQFS